MRSVTYLLFLLVSTTLLALSCNIGPTKISEIEPLQTKGDLTWYHISDAEKLAAIDKKKIFIDVYTDWCGWCKVMDRKTFTDPEVIAYLKENYHLVKFNAEQKEPILYNGKEYIWINRGRRGVNRLAMELLNGRLGYPTIVYLDENLNKIRVSPGYKDAKRLLNELKTIKT